MLYLDLDEIDSVFRGRWFWSARWPAPAWFRRRDYLAPSEKPLREAVAALVRDRTGRAPDGPIRMLTQVRNFWYVQNPVTFYYCFDRKDEVVETVVAEITNTPWGERHAYVLSVAGEPAPVSDVRAAGGARDGVRARFPKAFHVSPFIDMDAHYDWFFSRPASSLFVHMNVDGGDGRFFDATLRLERREISGRALAGTLVRHPFMTWKIAVAIYYHALRLRLKGCRFFTHPSKRRLPERPTTNG